MSNPQKAPENEIANKRTIKAGSLLKGIAWGIGLDLAFSLIIPVAGMFIYLVYLASTGMSQVEIEKAASGMQSTSSDIFRVLLAISYLGTIVSGYVCCRVAGEHARPAVSISALAMVIIGLALGVSLFTWLENLIFSALTGAAFYASYRLHLRANT